MQTLASTRAASEAAQRVASCRERITALRARAPITAEDVSRAFAALERSRFRERRASARLLDTQISAQHRQRSAAESVRELAQPRGADLVGDALRSRLAAGGQSLALVFGHYFQLGGACSALELDAWVHGALTLPTIERALLAHSLWELDEFGAAGS
jgi:hypothetical protein